jgi:hypothetical protein
VIAQQNMLSGMNLKVKTWASHPTSQNLLMIKKKTKLQKLWLESNSHLKASNFAAARLDRS